jgi:hypothetical protein
MAVELSVNGCRCKREERGVVNNACRLLKAASVFAWFSEHQSNYVQPHQLRDKFSPLKFL